MIQKNLNADLTNPNVYHNIDENNVEHVYDEITQKEGCKDPGMTLHFSICTYIWYKIFIVVLIIKTDEYDHLDYTRAGTSFNPHYHRMDDKLNIVKDEKEVKESNIGNNNLDAPGRSLMDSSKSSYSSEDSNS